MSRLEYAQKAVRPALKGRVMLAGPPGAGKTRTGLIVGETLLNIDFPGFEKLPWEERAGRFLVVDTEKESALTYADDHAFTHLRWSPPFDPAELKDLITEASTQYAVVMVDSLSHFWHGSGGILDVAAGKFTGWKVARPMQEDLVEAILGAHSHVILGVRSKTEYVQTMKDGKHTVEKVGMAARTDDTLEFEMNVCAEMNMEHELTVSKSRCISVPVGAVFHAGHAQDFATIYADWLRGGEPPAKKDVVDALLERINALPPTLGQIKPLRACKQEFFTAVGRPEHLAESKVPLAESIVAKWEGVIADSAAGSAPSVSDDGPSDPTDEELAAADAAARQAAEEQAREALANEPDPEPEQAPVNDRTARAKESLAAAKATLHGNVAESEPLPV